MADNTKSIHGVAHATHISLVEKDTFHASETGDGYMHMIGRGNSYLQMRPIFTDNPHKNLYLLLNSLRPSDAYIRR